MKHLLEDFMRILEDLGTRTSKKSIPHQAPRPTWRHPLHPEHLRGKGQAHHGEAHGGDGVAQLLGPGHARGGLAVFFGLPFLEETSMHPKNVNPCYPKRCLQDLSSISWYFTPSIYGWCMG